MNFITTITDRDTWFFRSSTWFNQIHVNGLSGTDGAIFLNGQNIYYQISGSTVFITTIQGLTGNWENTYTTVAQNSSIWNSTSDIIFLSGQIDQNTGDISNISSISGNWNSVFSTVFLNSATTWLGDSAVDSLVHESSGNWNSVYTTVLLNSGTTWLGDSAVNNLVHESSGNWNLAYTNIITNSAAYLSSVDLGDIPSLSSNWNSVYATVFANSATTWLGDSAVDSVVHETSASWNAVYSTVQTNSADWISTTNRVSEYAFFTVENPLGFASGDRKHIFVPLGADIEKVRVLSYWGLSTISLCWLDTVFSASGDQTFDVNMTVTAFPQRIEFLTSGSNGVFLQFR